MKCFLSHSSKDKSRYVRVVADQLKSSMLVFDEATFEEGMPTSAEILKGLDITDIFVLFISNESLNSNWVKEEVAGAYSRLSRGDIDRIYPIIIDTSIKHDD
jgi:TIR domain